MNAPQPDAVANLAEELVAANIPYVRSAATSTSPQPSDMDIEAILDSSGLCRYFYHRLIGKVLPRTAQAQFAAGYARVPVTQARPGDLVFPHDNFGADGPEHVQVYLGDDKVLEVAEPGDVIRVAPLRPSAIMQYREPPPIVDNPPRRGVGDLRLDELRISPGARDVLTVAAAKAALARSYGVRAEWIQITVVPNSH